MSRFALVLFDACARVIAIPSQWIDKDLSWLPIKSKHGLFKVSPAYLNPEVGNTVYQQGKT
jgi:hypothetical protein